MAPPTTHPDNFHHPADLHFQRADQHQRPTHTIGEVIIVTADWMMDRIIPATGTAVRVATSSIVNLRTSSKSTQPVANNGKLSRYQSRFRSTRCARTGYRPS